MELVSTLPKLLNEVKNKYSNPKSFNDKIDNNWISYSTHAFFQEVVSCCLGLHQLGVKKGDSIAIISDTNTNWMIMDLAIMCNGAFSVPMFPNLSQQNLEYELKDASVDYVYLASALKASYFEEHQQDFKKIIISGIDIGKSDNVMTIEQLKILSEKVPAKMFNRLLDIAEPDDLATIVYTSGSTGVPKGVELTHRNLINQVVNIAKLFPLDTHTDRAVSFLPTAHIFERTVVYFYLSRGVSIYFTPNVALVGEIIGDVKPTMMTVVPRVLEKVHSKTLAKALLAPFPKNIIAKLAFRRASKKRPGSVRTLGDLIYDKLVYTKIREKMGGAFRMIISGGSALSERMLTFFWNVGIKVYQGYGLTESAPVIAANSPEANRNGTVGKLLPSVEVKLSDEGEILTRSASVMRGYHNMPEETSKVIDADGFLYTGDLGSIDRDGYLKITGRKKEMYKTSTGEYVSPVALEQKLREHELVGQALVIAEGRNFTTCLLFPDYETIAAQMQKRNMESMNVEDFFAQSAIQEEIAEHIDQMNEHLNNWERVVKYKMIFKELTIDHGELTPKLNMRRSFVEEEYHKEIEQLYEKPVRRAKLEMEDQH
ncbi:long-chain fatty acid--CoA ligase [Puteibacter caeruleilacunae]|nr:long-chain fatty acid--CoA ligase [Puteibacter caeruleilacunae]